MSEIFLKIVNMSISASWIVLAVLVLRLLLKKAPKWITVLLWGIVAVRLVCPFSIESAMSLIPSAQTVNPQIMTQSVPSIDSGIPIINEAVNPIINEMANPIINNSSVSASEPSISPLQILMPILSIIWVVGIVVMIAYTVISYINVKIKIGTAVRFCDNIYQSEGVVSPFVLGIIAPKIYLPFNMSENDMEHVIAHERAHLHRRDHLWKPLGFLILTIHWFNPLMWISYILLCRDIELACDEKVIKKLNTEKKADYSQALLTCSVSRRFIAACPIAFGEVSVKDRVKSVLSYKKPTIWIIIAAVVSTVVVAVCFLTNPIGSNNTTLLKVLNNEKKVIDEAGKSIYLRDYKVGESRDISITPLKYAFVDFDADGTDEMVLSAAPSDYGAYIVFHIYNRKVYGFEFSARELIALKKDGTFYQSESAFINSCAGLAFEKNTCKVVEKAYQNYTGEEFRIEGKAVSSPDVYDYISEFYDKEDVVWKQCQSDENKIDYKSIYNSFLDGEITAADKDGNKKTVIEYLDQTMYGYNEDYGYSYTFCDMTNDGISELCIRHQFATNFFTIKNGEIYYWYGEDGWGCVWLSNGAFLYKHASGAPTNRVYEYYELDENGYKKFSVDFSWWDVAYKDDPELYDYEFDGQKVSKKEWEEKTEKYLKYDVVDDGRVWYNKS